MTLLSTTVVVYKSSILRDKPPRCLFETLYTCVYYTVHSSCGGARRTYIMSQNVPIRNKRQEKKKVPTKYCLTAK